jgi:aminopeptidase N
MTSRLFTIAAVFLLAAVVTASWVVLFRFRSPGQYPGPGVSLTLAAGRASRISHVTYDLSLRVPPLVTDSVRGVITATFSLSGGKAPLAFDFSQPADHLLAASVNGQAFAATTVTGHIIVPAELLIEGQNSVTFEFVAGDEALNRQADLFYSLFVPARASWTFPCFDQPDIKARWRVALDIPRSWQAVSNGRETDRIETVDAVTVRFEETAPIPTYLFAVTAGRFDIETGDRNGRTYRLLHRETDAGKLDRNLDAIFDQHAKAIAWMEDYTGIPYAFGKFDMVLLPAFQFSGMEHPGTVYYNANSLLLDETATQTQHLSRANVIAHETAHMWFGNLVTMTWFNDVWMKEVFANFMAARIVNPSFPAMNHDLRFLVQHHPAAYDVDRTDGANPIRQDLHNLNEAGSLYGAIIYQKAPIVLRQLELLLGADELRDGLREYLSAYALSNASWPDLVDILDARTPLDLAAWSRAWIDEPGRPTLSSDVRIENGRVTQLTVRQSDSRARDLVWPQRLKVITGRDEATETFEITLDGADHTIERATGMLAPDWILPLGGGLGYGDVDLDPVSLAFLGRAAHTIDDPVTRTAAFITLWEAVLDGQVAPEDYFTLLVHALPVERNELTLQLLLDQTRATFWRFTREDARAAAAGRLEPVLRTGLARAATTSEKAVWFAALRNTALSAASLAWLERVWARQEQIDGLPLSELDETDLAMDLAVRDVPGADDLLAAQVARIDNADRRARLSFIAQALSADAAVRTAFFEGLRDVRRRAREAWVIDAVRYLHHPLRASDSRRLVRAALELLPEIQKTGDIFFPKRWTDATLGGYQSRAVADDVREIIDRLPPDYPHRLRWVLLASADPLIRAATIVEP